MLRFASIATLTGSLAFAQQTPPPGGPGSPAAPGGGATTMSPQHPFQPGGREPFRDREGDHARTIGMRGGEGRIAPPGMWWKNPELVQRIGLSPDQQKRMDEIFQNSRIQLIDLKANVDKQEVTLEPLLDVNPIDAKRVLAQIGKVADARAELEKANAAMLLGIRGVLTPDQWTKLHADDRNHRHMGLLRGEDDQHREEHAGL